MNSDLKPGSKEAVDKGCLCPIIDNFYGEGVPTTNGRQWYMHEDCPLHGSQKSRIPAEVAAAALGCPGYPLF